MFWDQDHNLVVKSGSTETVTHITKSELPDGPLRRLAFREHFHTDLSVHNRLVSERPVVVALYLKTRQTVTLFKTQRTFYDHNTIRLQVIRLPDQKTLHLLTSVSIADKC